MIITRKLQVIPEIKTKEEFNGIYKKIRNYMYFSYKLANDIITKLFLNTFIKNELKEKKLKKEEISKTIKDIYKSKSEQNIPYIISKNYEDKLPSCIRASLSQKVLKDYKTDILNILCGNKSLRNYKRENMNIYFPLPKIKEHFKKEEKKYIFKWIEKINFKINFGRDKSNNKIIIEKILSKDYIPCDSFLKVIKNKIFLFLSIDISNIKRKLDNNIIVGIDVGYSCLAYCGLNNGLSRLALGKNDSENSIQYRKKQIISRKKDIQKKLKLCKGGKGREKKLKYLENFKEKERNYMQTKNHQISAEIIKFAIKNNAGIIQMENLKNIQDDIQNSWLKRNWAYYQLQKMIEYKAIRNGIETKYINPKNTSKMCSICGNIKEKLELCERIYKCENPKCESFNFADKDLLNRDYNASVNIARSTSYIKKVCGKVIKNKKIT